ncbi:hypothetical protein CR956_00370 [Candidatus Saccharibacteria bacterium]|nr:MAG: hypothetical protein CR956_00370 [Candidatus Saccharibacteria bacterium]
MLAFGAIGANFLIKVNAESQPSGMASRGEYSITDGKQKFFVYVKPGERLKGDFEIAHKANSGANIDITAYGPGGGVVASTSLSMSDSVGDTASFDYSVSSGGVYMVEFGASPVSGTQFTLFYWDLGAYSSWGSPISGRVWTEKLMLSQRLATDPSAGSDMALYMMDKRGYRYRVEYGDFWGIDSTITTNNVGLSNPGEGCRSRYGSGSPSGYAEFGAPDAKDRYLPSCGEIFKIFLSNPDPSMPSQVSLPDGDSTWLYRSSEPEEVYINNLTYNHNAGSSHIDGHITANISGDHIGDVNLMIDTNDNGSYDDGVDIVREVQLDTSGNFDFAYDGKDNYGNWVTANKISIKLTTKAQGEIHFVRADVEKSGGGIEVQRLNGGWANRYNIYWDDSKISDSRCGSKPSSTSGPNGTSSAGGTHSWDPKQWGPICPGNADAAGNLTSSDPASSFPTESSWGNMRHIEDWTYDKESVKSEIIIGYAPSEFHVQKELNPDIPYAGVDDKVKYRITVTNRGAPDTPTMVDNLPSGTHAVGPYPSGCSPTNGGQSIKCVATQPLGKDQSITYDLWMQIDSFGNRQNLENVAKVHGPHDPICVDESSAVGRCMDTEIVRRGPELYIDKKLGLPASAPYAAPGEQVDYTITVTNRGYKTTPTMVDELPEGLIGISASSPAGNCTIDNNTRIIKCIDNQDLDTGESRDYQVRVEVVDFHGKKSLDNVARTFGPGDNKCIDENSTAERCHDEEKLYLPPELYIEKKLNLPADAPYAPPGTNVSYDIIVTNKGYPTIPTMRDELPEGMEGVSGVSPHGTCTVQDNKQTVECVDNQPLGTDKTRTYTVTVKIVDFHGQKSLKNIARTFGPGDTECKDKNSTAPRCNDDELIYLPPELYIEKKLDLPEETPYAAPGEKISYTIKITNKGYKTKPTMVDNLPQGLAVDQADMPANCTANHVDPDGPDKVTCVSPDFLETDQTMTYKIYATVIDFHGKKFLENVAKTFGPGDTECKDENSTAERCGDDEKVYLPPELYIDKMIDLPPEKPYADPGEKVSYTIKITNKGYKTKPTMVDKLPRGLAISKPDLPSDCTAEHVDPDGPDTVTCVSPNFLGTDETMTYKIYVIVVDFHHETYLTNIAKTFGPGDTECKDVESTAERCGDDEKIYRPPEYYIQKDLNIGYAEPGDEIKYTLTVKNEGYKSTPTIVDHIPDGMYIIKTKLPTDCLAPDERTVECKPTQMLETGESLSYEIYVEVIDFKEDNNLKNVARVHDPEDPGCETIESELERCHDDKKLYIPPEFHIEKTADVEYVKNGSFIKYTLKVWNRGYMATPTIVDQLPEGIHVLQNKLPSSCIAKGERTVECVPSKPLQPDETITYDIHARVYDFGDKESLDNIARVYSPEDKGCADENSELERCSSKATVKKDTRLLSGTGMNAIMYLLAVAPLTSLGYIVLKKKFSDN